MADKPKQERRCGKCQKAVEPEEVTRVGLCKPCLEVLDNWQHGPRQLIGAPISAFRKAALERDASEYNNDRRR